MDRIARNAIVIGVLIMIVATFSCMEDSGSFVTSSHRAMAQYAIFFGAAIAIVIPVIAVFVDYARRRKP